MSWWCSPPTSWSISCMPGSIQGYAMLKARHDAVVGRTEARWRGGGWHSVGAALVMFARKQPLGALGGMVLLTVIAIALLAPFLAPFDAYEGHVGYKRSEEGGEEGDGNLRQEN